MTPFTLYALAGGGIFLLGLLGTLTRAHLFWRILGVNFMGSGIFLILIAGAPRLPDHGADPVPQAMVLTGIVVAVSATALALGIALRVVTRTGAAVLSEDLRRRHGWGTGSQAEEAETDDRR